MGGGSELYISHLNLKNPFFLGGEMLQVDPAHIFFQMCGSVQPKTPRTPASLCSALHCEVQEAFHLSAGVAPLLAIRSSEAWI